ncbi:uncharacterized protein [Haliotis cracherodii]|uniref:uncharacterized protein n=1 Tax=Haliotis cracherodii TaxID=6455 RepID=UPI0039E762F5
MASVQMMFDLVLINTLPTNYMAVMKVDSVLGCAHECIRESTCEAMAFGTLHTACYLYQGSIQADPSATSNMDLLIYNFKRGPECNGVFAGVPKPLYPVCPIGKGYNYKPKMNVCYKYHSNEVTHQVAKSTCISEGGSDLLKVDTDKKQNFFKDIVSSGSYAYIQGDRIGSGQWVYWEETTAVVMTNTYWADNEPNGASFDQDCVSISTNGQHDARCDFTNYFFCEKYM